MTITFRKPLPDEAEAFAGVHVQSWRESYASYLPQELLASFSVQKRLPMWNEVLANPDRFVLGAFVDGQPAGFVISGATTEQHAEKQDGHLWAIYVLEAFRRRGVGQMLLRRAAQDWLLRGGSTMTLGVLSDNLPARAFYEAMGARFVKDGTYKWDGHPLKDCIYIFEDLKSLTP